MWFEFSGAVILRHFAGARLRYLTKAPAQISRAGFILISTYRLLQMKSIWESLISCNHLYLPSGHWCTTWQASIGGCRKPALCIPENRGEFSVEFETETGLILHPKIVAWGAGGRPFERAAPIKP